ncbi:hypothetical protein FVE85_0381 [Porphyridium purpureum]|uniref:DUF1995 domain-containing protein n=1 Tax=Porphyridium purpureum TaxID=35688 RepID=A0A5J4Z0L6_PORPP|nr:hypothetical protein FVE85_0381 [Porphyridium purpureum]|eukprot:POR0614..scf208_2
MADAQPFYSHQNLAFQAQGSPGSFCGVAGGGKALMCSTTANRLGSATSTRCRARVAGKAGEGASVERSEEGQADLQRLVADFPKLYDAWFDGQLKRLLTESVMRAQDQGIRGMEVSFPAVPNLDEIDFGTATNQKFAEMLAGDELMTGYRKVRKYLLAYANVFWALQVTQTALKPEETAIILSTDGVDKSDLTTVPPNVRVMSLTAAAKLGGPLSEDMVIMVDPRSTETWKQVDKLTKPGARVIFMNSSFNETYGLTGPLKELEPVLFMRRISKGWIFRSYPSTWVAILELPDGSIEALKDMGTQTPVLGKTAAIVRDESFKRFGIFNDRYAKGFGARL